MSRKVDEMNTRTVFQMAAIRQARGEQYGSWQAPIYPVFARHRNRGGGSSYSAFVRPGS